VGGRAAWCYSFSIVTKGFLMARTATTPEAAAAGIPPGWEFARQPCGGIFVRPPTFSTGIVVHKNSISVHVMLFCLADDLLTKAGVDEILPLKGLED
jgi:hypothetical protein